MTIDTSPSDGMHDDLHWEALARFHAGESTPDESERIRAQLAASPADARFLELLASAMNPEADSGRIPMSAGRIDQALIAVRRRLIAVDETARPTLTVVRGGAARVASSSATTASSRRWKFAGIAAAAMLAVAFLSRDWLAGTAAVPFTASSQLVATSAMQQDSLLLADGTRIVVGAGSRISIDSGYNRAHRTVTLDGIAYFTVAHDGRHPFVVRTNAADVQDIGTAFVVKTSPAGDVVVSVTDGSVRLTRADQSSTLELVAGERATIVAGASTTVSRKVDTEADAAWTIGRLVYRDAPISEVLADLTRWYGVNVQADAALMGRTLRAELPKDSLAQALRVVALALGADVTERADRVVLAVPGSGRR